MKSERKLCRALGGYGGCLSIFSFLNNEKKYRGTEERATRKPFLDNENLGEQLFTNERQHQGAEATEASTAGSEGDRVEEEEGLAEEELGAEAAEEEEEDEEALLAPVGGIPTVTLPFPPRL